jgi:predicted transcriptional regulator
MYAITQYDVGMNSYINQLESMAAPTARGLVFFFKLANVPTSTYYRARQGKDLRLSTANKVADAIRVYTLHDSETNQ